jgi:hypothetical protein
VGVGLEKLGGSAEAVLRFFTEHDYELFVGLKEFKRFRRGMALPRERFYLVEFRREPAGNGGERDQKFSINYAASSILDRSDVHPRD